MYGKMQATTYPTLNSSSFIPNTSPTTNLTAATIHNTKPNHHHQQHTDTTVPSELKLNYNTCSKASTSDNFAHFSTENLKNKPGSFKTNMFYHQQQQQHQQIQLQQQTYHTNNNYQQQLDLPEQSKHTTANVYQASSSSTPHHLIEDQKKFNNLLISSYSYSHNSLNHHCASSTSVNSSLSSSSGGGNALHNQSSYYYLPYNQQFQQYHNQHFLDSTTSHSSTLPSSSSYENFSSTNDTSNPELSIGGSTVLLHNSQHKFGEETTAATSSLAVHYDNNVYSGSTKPSITNVANLDSSAQYKNLTLSAAHKQPSSEQQTGAKILVNNGGKFIFKSNDDRIKKAFGIELSEESIANNMNNNNIRRQAAVDFDESKASDDNSSLFRNGATLRERNRMHILNDAFDDLRKIVPKTNLSEHQRLSKIATLRLAIHYISALTKILQNSGGCRPVDPSLLPPTPKRKRRRKIKVEEGMAASATAPGALVVVANEAALPGNNLATNKKSQKLTGKKAANKEASGFGNTNESSNANKIIKLEVNSI
jgi:hypothetical protein